MQTTNRTACQPNASNAAAHIAYAICADAPCNLPIAINGTLGFPVSAANETDVRLPVFGRLTLPGQLPPGTYNDVVTVTLTW